MNSELVQSQLVILLTRQPERLASQKIKPEYFEEPYQELYLALVKLYVGGGKVNFSNLGLTQGLSDAAKTAITRLQAYEDPEVSFDNALDFIKDKFVRASFSKMVRDAYDNTHNEKKDIEDSINSLQTKIIGLTHGNTSTLHHGPNFEGVNKAIDWMAKNPGKLMGPSTGFIRLDRTVNGFTPRFVLIGARPSVGKTALVGNFIEALCEEGEAVYLASLEMSADQYRFRLLAQRSGVNLSSFRKTAFNDFEIKAIAKAQREIKKWKWWINDNPDATIEQIEADVASLISKHGKVHVFVDYLQLVECSATRDRFEKLGIISSRLKKMSLRNEINVVACAQLKRMEGRFDHDLKRVVFPEPQIQDFRESGNLEQDADLCMLLHRDIINDPEVAKLIIGKQRNGETHPGIDLTYMTTITKFKETPK